MSILGQSYDDQIKKFEGYAPRATWDYKQNSVGWGTRAKAPGEVIDQAEAQRRYDDEIGKAHGIVKAFAPNIDPGTAAALTSLTYNAGDAWTRSGLGQAIKDGDLDRARASFLQYVNAGGAPLDGLRKRRAAEVAWFGAQPAQQQPPDGMDQATYGAASPAVASYPQRAPANGMPMDQTQQQEPTFLDQLTGRMSNPLFQQGLGMFLAASQGGDLNQGVSQGMSRSNAWRQQQMQDAELRQKREQEARVNQLLQNPSSLGNLPPALVAIAQATRNLGPVNDYITKVAEQSTPQAQAQLQLTQAQAKKAAAEADDGGSKVITTSDGRIVRVNRDGSTQIVGETDNVNMRKQQVVAAGLDPNSEQSKVFIATGKMPREDQQSLTATDKKAILEADEMVSTNETAIGYLKKAIELSPQAYFGPTAGVRGYVTSLTGSQEGQATEQLSNVVATNALQSLKSIFGGNPTEGERKILLDIQGSVSKAPAVREAIYREAIQLAERRLEFNRKRAAELRNREYYKSDAQKAQASQAGKPAEAPKRLKFNPETGALE